LELIDNHRLIASREGKLTFTRRKFQETAIKLCSGSAAQLCDFARWDIFAQYPATSKRA